MFDPNLYLLTPLKVPPPQPPPGMTVLEDLFVDTNGTNLTAHTMNIGPGWTAQAGGTLTIESNSCQSPSTFVQNLYTSDSGYANTTASVTVSATGAALDILGLCLRFADVNNYWTIYAIANGNVWKFLELGRTETGNSSAVASVALPSLPTNVSYMLQIQTSGPNFYASFGGYTLNYTDGFNATDTVCGLFATDLSQPGIYNNFKVTTP